MLTSTDLADALLARQLQSGAALDTLWLHGSETGRSQVKAAPSSHVALATLEQSAAADVAEGIARFTESTEVLEYLATKDKRKTVRRAVAENKATPSTVLAKLLAWATRKTTWHEPTQVVLLKREDLPWTTISETYRSGLSEDLSKDLCGEIARRAFREGREATLDVLSWSIFRVRTEMVSQISRSWGGPPPVTFDEALATLSVDAQWNAVKDHCGSRRGSHGTLSHEFVTRALGLYDDLNTVLQQDVKRLLDTGGVSGETIPYLLDDAYAGPQDIRDILLAQSPEVPQEVLAELLERPIPSGSPSHYRNSNAAELTALRKDLSEVLVLKALEVPRLMMRVVGREVPLSQVASDKVLDWALTQEHPTVAQVLAVTEAGDPAKRLEIIRKHGSWNTTKSWMKASKDPQRLVEDLLALVNEPGNAFMEASTYGRTPTYGDPLSFLTRHDAVEILTRKNVKDLLIDQVPGALASLASPQGSIFERLVVNLGERISNPEAIDLALGLAPTWKGSIVDLVSAVDLACVRR